MFYNVFEKIGEDISKKSTLTRPNIPTINPSSQVCYSEENGQQLGSCLRQVWFDKTNQVKTNGMALKVYQSGAAGDFWEDWFIDKIKNLKIYDDTQIIATDVSRMVKGLIDISFTNPNIERLELGEVKSYDGSNWYSAQTILGTKDIHPKPKDNHLLQAYRYLLVYQTEVEAINLFYVDRACSGWFKNKQFRVTLFTSGGKHYPKIEVIWNDSLFEYCDTRITDQAIYRTEEILLNHLTEQIVPDKDYEPKYSQGKIEFLFKQNKISKYAYDRYVKSPEENPIGDFQCKLCAYSNGTCDGFNGQS